MTTLQLSTIWKAWLRYLLYYPGQLILAVTGIALGVAVVVSIDLAKQSALDAFIQATETISGKASYRIIGHSGAIDEKIYTQLKLSDIPLRFLPKTEGYIKIDNGGGESIRILGIDPFSEPSFGSLQSLVQTSHSESEASDLAKILTEPGYVLISENTAQRLKIKANESLSIIAGGRKKLIKVAATLSFNDPVQQQAMEDLLLTDIASAQEILENFGRISRIDVIVPQIQQDTLALERLRQHLPHGTELINYRQINQNSHNLTASFYTNLSALSLLSFMVGIFLIYNTINFLAIRRRSLIGILRALGASRPQIFQLVTGEAAVLGLGGTLLGLLLGYILAHGLLGLISNTIDNVYFALPTPKLLFSLSVFSKGLVLGTLVSALTAVLPALQATRIEPLQAIVRSKLESYSEQHAFRNLFFGISALIIGVITILASQRSINFGFAGLMLLVFGCAMLTPFFVVVLSRLIYPRIRRIFGVIGSLPLRSLNANLSRSGIAIAALMVAISATIGVQIMVTSFRISVNEWLEKRLGAQLYINIPASNTINDGPLNGAFLSKLYELEGIRSIGTTRIRTIQHAKGFDRINIYDLTRESLEGFNFTAGNSNAIWDLFEKNDTVIITESYAYNHRLGVGSVLELSTDGGRNKFQITGIYADYNPGQGAIAMSRATYRRHWNDDSHSSFAIYTEKDTDLKQLQRQIHSLSDPNYVLTVSERSKIIGLSMQIFDQAFAVTDILQWLAATIAFLGVFSALTAIQLDRVWEYGILRANGITANQLARLITVESSLMGMVAGLLAIPVGAMVAAVLVFVINQRSFGWSINFHLPPEIIVKGLMSGIIAAVLAGLVPSFRMSQLSPAEALRNE